MLAIVLPLAGVTALALLGIVCLIAAGFVAARREERPGRGRRCASAR